MDNLSYLEDLYRLWRNDPSAIDNDWDTFFRDAESTLQTGDHPVDTSERSHTFKQTRVDSLLWAFRDVGYVRARLNPLGGDHGPDHHYLPSNGRAETAETLTPEAFGLSAADLDTEFFAGRHMQPSRMPLRDILAAFEETYCGAIGVEFLHIQDQHVRRWLMQRMEGNRNRSTVNDTRRRMILQDLLRTASFEQALNRYFMGQKRFSIEGAESIVPALHFLVDQAPHYDIQEIVLGTTHRGRLSILHTILNMSPEAVFSHFEENRLPRQTGGSGDVKYHIGFDTTHMHPDGTMVHIRIPANASHLESISGVVEGMARGRQDRMAGPERREVLPVILHGDAAFCGQGVVAETLNLARLDGYRTGGTIHVIINNQIGFTTASRQARSSVFPTDAAKGMQVPILHVNGDDPEAVVTCMELALEYRTAFGRDCIVDMFCFRRYGHNEGDDPSFTHPYMYSLVKRHPGVMALYGERCEQLGIMTRERQDELREMYDNRMRDGHEKSQREEIADDSTGQGAEWDGLDAPYSFAPVPTGVDADILRHIGTCLTTIPDGFTPHARLEKLLERKREMLETEGLADWSLAEALACGSLLLEGIPVRISGEDCVRGTFSQRHFAWWDIEAEAPTAYLPLNNLGPQQAPLAAFDSPLSEYSVLAFEYGYSLVRPRTLILWEAQFGDFANGAQVTIDNYIAAAETKWAQHSGLVLLLPHGHEGQGPDHTSARLERFLQLAGENNMEVCNVTTPAQYFHLLRRQVLRRYRRPLVLMSPKSLLRHPEAVSPLAALTDGAFAGVLDDPAPPKQVTRLLFCSGKVYYDLAAARAAQPDSPCAIIRIEQLYPFPAEALQACLGRYPQAETFVWVQEENRNAGAWSAIAERLEALLPGQARPVYVGRHPAASSATGIFKHHVKEQDKLVREALGIEQGARNP